MWPEKPEGLKFLEQFQKKGNKNIFKWYPVSNIMYTSISEMGSFKNNHFQICLDNKFYTYTTPLSLKHLF